MSDQVSLQAKIPILLTKRASFSQFRHKVCKIFAEMHPFFAFLFTDHFPR